MGRDHHRGDGQQAGGEYPAAVGDLRQQGGQAAEQADQGEGAQAGLDVRLAFPFQADQQADADAGGKGLQVFVFGSAANMASLSESSCQAIV
jgi:hypothetical protein